MKVLKNSLSLALVSILLWSCGGNEKTEMEIGQYTTIEVREVIDAGTVAKGATVHAEVKIKNTGDFPLYIANIKPACSCTVSEYDKSPIAPGETTVINAEIDTDATGSGVINKPINITANTKPAVTTVTLKAKVID